MSKWWRTHAAARAEATRSIPADSTPAAQRGRKAPPRPNAHEGAPAHGVRWWPQVLSAVSSALFHAGLLSAPLSLGALAAELADPGGYDFTPGADALARTRAALDETLQRLRPERAQMLETVHAALMQDRPEIARGLLLATVAEEPYADPEKLQMAARQLSFNDRALLEQASPPPTAGTPPSPPRSPAAEEAMARNFAVQSARWLIEQPIDDVAWRLLGLQLDPALSPQQQRDVRDAAHLLRFARRSGHLSPELNRHLRARLEAAFPTPALYARITRAFRSAEVMAVRDAFTAARNQDATQALMADLAAVAAMQRAAPQPAALDMLHAMDTPSTLARWRLLAEAGGERLAALMALSDTQTTLQAARGVLQVTPRIRALLGLLMGALALVMLGAMGAAYAESRRLR